VSTDAGITGYSDMETVASVAKAAVEAPRWSEPGLELFDGLASLVVGENPLEVERLWYKMYRGSIYFGGRGVAIQALSAIDIALWDLWGSSISSPSMCCWAESGATKSGLTPAPFSGPLPKAMREAVRSYLDQGFTAIKFGWGVFGKDHRLDVRLVEAARSAMGDSNDLLIDTGWFVERTRSRPFRWFARSNLFGRSLSRNFFIPKITMDTGKWPRVSTR